MAGLKAFLIVCINPPPGGRLQARKRSEHCDWRAGTTTKCLCVLRFYSETVCLELLRQSGWPIHSLCRLTCHLPGFIPVWTLQSTAYSNAGSWVIRASEQANKPASLVVTWPLYERCQVVLCVHGPGVWTAYITFIGMCVR